MVNIVIIAIVLSCAFYIAYRFVRSAVRLNRVTVNWLVRLESDAKTAWTEQEVERLINELGEFQNSNHLLTLDHRVRLLGNKLVVKKAHLEIERLTSTLFSI